MNKPIIFFHKDCSDGMSSAWAAWKYFGNNAEYVALSHSDAVPVPAIKERDVYFLDIAPKEKELDVVFAGAKTITIIDHHESNAAVVKTVNNGSYSMEHSGAVLTWMYFHKDKPVPKLLLLVEDMDLWLFRLPETKPISLALSLISKELAEWNSYVDIIEDNDRRAEEVEKGKLLLQYADKEIEEFAKDAEEVRFEGYSVFMANASSRFTSALGHLLAAQKPPISLVWSRRRGEYKVSLRSDGSVNVAKLASLYGGGGHPGAAAFRIPTDGWVSFFKKLST